MIISGETARIGGRCGGIAGIVELNDLQLGAPDLLGKQGQGIALQNAQRRPLVEIVTPSLSSCAAAGAAALTRIAAKTMLVSNAME